MFKKTALIIATTILIAQLAGFYEKNFLGENNDVINRYFQVSISNEVYTDEHLDNKPPIKNIHIKNTSPRLYTNAKMIKQDNHIFIPFYTMINIKSSNLIANS